MLSIASTRRGDDDLFIGWSPHDVQVAIGQLAALHLAKIDLADEVLVLNVGGYIGRSTAEEVAYAMSAGKHIRYLEP